MATKSRWAVLIAVGVAGLACAGGEAEPEPVPEPAPAEPEPVHPLVLDAAYEAGDGEDAQAIVFHEDGSCEHVVVNTYACTWEGAGEPGGWTAKITAYTSAVTPAGETIDVDRQAGTAWQVADDGATLAADGLTLALADEDGEGEDGEDGDGAEDGDGDDGEATPTPRPDRSRTTPKPGGPTGARPRDGGDDGDPAPKTGKGKGAKAKPRP